LSDFFIGHLQHARFVLVDFFAGEAVEGALGGVHHDVSVFIEDVALDPGSGDVGLEGDVVFDLAGLDAEAATDALVRVDQESPTHLRPGSENRFRVEPLQSR
jgi:hypothetical protein